MKTIITNIKDYFYKKEKDISTETAPKGMCPDCWGREEWDGQFYEIVKDKHLIPNNDKYESFISKIVEKHIETTHIHENKYICTTCNKPIKN